MKLGKYQHYKGKFYEVIGIARHSENLEEFIVYKALYDDMKHGKNTIWIRPKKMFLEKINSKEIERFKLIE